MKIHQQNSHFDILYAEYYDWLLKKIVRMTQDRDLAEDITQNTFMIVYLKYYKAQNCDDISFPKSFLFTIARNLLFNIYEHEKVVSGNSNDYTLYSQMGYESSINCEQLMNEVKQLLAPPEQDIFVLWCFYGYTLKEISCFMHISPSRVFLKLKSSKIKLRNGLRISL